MVAEQTGTRPRIKIAAPRRKRRDTHVGTIEALTGLDFGVRSDMHLGTLLERRNAEWLIEILGEGHQMETELDTATEAPDEAASPASAEADDHDEVNAADVADEVETAEAA